MNVTHTPLQAPYTLLLVAAHAVSMAKPVVGHRFTARVSSVISRGLELSRATSIATAGDRWTVRFLLNGRPIAIEAPADAARAGPVTFSVWVDAVLCSQNAESPAALALRAVEVLGLDDFPAA